MKTKYKKCARLPFVVATLVLMLAGVVNAQFGVNRDNEWVTFEDFAAGFSLNVPPGWTFQTSLSDPSFFVFYGPGELDLFYLEIIEVTKPSTTAASAAQIAIDDYYKRPSLRNFSVISPPSPGTLAGKEASFIVYSYSDQAGNSMIEGRAFVVHNGKLYTLAFADTAAQFDHSVPTFNTVMESLKLADQPVPGGGFGSTPSPQPQPEIVPGVYYSPGGFYRLTTPSSWVLWEEQSTARGDTVEPWHGVFAWEGKQMTKSLFVWDYFDELEQRGAQYEVVLAVIEDVPGTQDQAIEMLKNNVAGTAAGTYTTTSTRVLLGTQPAVAVQTVTKPGMVELWSEGTPWHRTVTFYAFKRGNTFFVWVVPNEIAENAELGQTMRSFRWMGN